MLKRIFASLAFFLMFISYGESSQEKSLNMDDIQRQDIESWMNTLFPDQNKQRRIKLDGKTLDQELKKIDFMKRVFLTLVALKLNYTTKPNEREDLKPWPYSVSVALSHGQRILIEGNKISSKDILLLFSGTYTTLKQPGIPPYIKPRILASHDITWNKVNKQVKEVKVKGARGAITAARQVLGRAIGKKYHYGIDLPLGGLGNGNPLGDLVGPGGTSLNPKTYRPRKDIQYGHLYICPRDFKGFSGVLMGVEGEAPGKTGAFGNKHNFVSGIRSSVDDASIWGSVKMAKLPIPDNQIPHTTGGMILFMNGSDASFLNEMFKAFLALPEEDQSLFFNELFSAPTATEAYDMLETILQQLGRGDVADYLNERHR